MKYTIREPYARKYCEDNVLLRDVNETVGWECSYIQGSFWATIKRSFEHLRGMGSLEHFGFVGVPTFEFPADPSAPIVEGVLIPLVVSPVEGNWGSMRVLQTL